jgi:hypothetical protein
MPELPEVEIARRILERWLGGSEVVGAEAERTRVFRAGGRAAFGRLRGRLARADRHGKLLLVSLESGQGFLSHLGMTGKWIRRPAGEPVPYSRARLLLADGSVVHYRDTRLFGRIEPHPAEALRTLPALQALGPDPLLTPLSGRQLREALGQTRVPIKVALMDQRRPPGWEHPRRRGALAGAAASGPTDPDAGAARLEPPGHRHPPRPRLRPGCRGRGGDRLRRGARDGEPFQGLRSPGRTLPTLRHAHPAAAAGGPENRPVSPVPAGEEKQGMTVHAKGLDHVAIVVRDPRRASACGATRSGSS